MDRNTLFANNASLANSRTAVQADLPPPAVVADPELGPRVVVVKTVPVSAAPKSDAAEPEAVAESSNQKGAEPQLKQAPVQLAAAEPKTHSQNVQVAAVGPAPMPSNIPPERGRSSSDEQQGTKSARMLNPDEVQILLKRGEEYLSSGDFAAARLILKRLAEARNARAALMLAGSYDPLILEQLNAYAFVADVGMARAWYEKAREFGSPEAMQRLELLASTGR